MREAIQIRFFLLSEWIKQLFRYLFSQPKYFFADMCLVLSYFFTSPYRLVRRWDESHAHKIGPYGEIPIFEMEDLYGVLLNELPITSITDFGAGRGRIALWAACTKGLKVHAVECVPTFCRKLKKQLSLFDIRNVTVHEVNAQSFQIVPSDLVLMNLGDLELEDAPRMLQALSSLPSGSFVLTAGFSLSTLDRGYQFEGSFQLRCPWGSELAVLTKKI